jgi:hypothetical protein
LFVALDKRIDIRLGIDKIYHELAKKENNKELVSFTEAILKVYEKYDMNGHIKWNK